ncbi:hypothetical protein GCM10012275_62420 [Longimycelium tulufanense]|uniref:Uncharacterized protein n=1 Tax=Longimycelium tulufanense TaxID=907463 RepID=A0A8J3CEV4_9PSEU|nr:hypothetical protein [Longimycelium tulufanense]GGM83331.1 hypothetical protein GCM10012275_62420 [Longimycelium tulufanense]
MTGPEHYHEGEKYLHAAETGTDVHGGWGIDNSHIRELYARIAAAHFAAAQAAATALQSTTGYAVTRPEVQQWQAITAPVSDNRRGG